MLNLSAFRVSSDALYPHSPISGLPDYFRAWLPETPMLSPGQTELLRDIKPLYVWDMAGMLSQCRGGEEQKLPLRLCPDPC